MISRRTHLLAILGGILAGLVVLLTGIWLGGHPGDLPSLLRGRPFESRSTDQVTGQALDILTTRYYRPLNRSTLVDEGLSGMVASLDDPWSHYVDPSANREPRSEPEVVTGIGIDAVPDARGLRVVNVFEHSPAADAGLVRGDLIIKVDTTSLANRAEELGFKLIKGPAGTRVTLTFLRDGTQLAVSVVRAKTTVPVAVGRMLDYHGRRIGYLRLTGFSEGSGDKLRAEVQTVLRAHAQALILDLRENGGGLIDQATPNGRNLGGGGARQGVGVAPNIYGLDDPLAPADEVLAVGERTVAAEVP